MKKNINKAVKHAEQIQSVALKFSEFKKIKVKGDDIVILYDELKAGSNIWASLADDNSRKMALPIGDYNLMNDRTVHVVQEGIIDKITYTQTHNEELRNFVQSFSTK